MWPFGPRNEYPYTDFHELNTDWILRKIIELDYKVKNWLNDVVPTIRDTVNTWLDDHPEATTTVQDGSLTSIKFKNDSIPFYNVMDYGILPNSGDIYEPLYDFLADTVYETGGIVYFPPGKYTVSYTVCIPENTMFIGAGKDTELYFNEVDATFGTCLTNAGSNVAIRNMLVSQKTQPPFSTGAQPGCIGFSDNAKSQARAGRYAHQFARAEVWNLSAEDVYFDGFYAIQTENDEDYPIHNVTYKNLYCPNSCVSVMSHNNIENVVIDNITCDLIRISIGEANSVLTNVTAKNIICQTVIASNPYSEDKIVFENLIQTKNARQNTYYNTYCAGLNGNVVFKDSILAAVAAETDGLGLYGGIHEFYGCIFNMQDRLCFRESALSNTDYEIFENCIFNSVSETTDNTLIGYGRNNTYNASNIKSSLWGDMHHTFTNAIGINDATNTYSAALIVDRDSITLKGYGTFNDTNALFTAGSRLQNLPMKLDHINVTVWAAGSRSTTTMVTYGTFTSNDLKITDPEISGSSAINRFIIDQKIQLTRKPTPEEIYAALLV